MDLSRMYRIAETGDVNDPTPVDNVLRMAEERQRQQQQARPQSAWGRFKNFAGSNAGRTLWGGLGTALGVGLTGGNLQRCARIRGYRRRQYGRYIKPKPAICQSVGLKAAGTRRRSG